MTFASKNRASCAVWVRVALLFVWFFASFGVAFFARDLSQMVAGWPLNFWLTAQGGVLMFIAVVMVYAWAMNRLEVTHEDPAPDGLPDEDARGGQ